MPLALVLILVGAGAGTLLDIVDPARTETPPLSGRSTTATSGAWYCGIGDTAGENGLTLIGAVPPDQPTSSTLRLDLQHSGETDVGAEAEVLPGTQHVQVVPSGRREASVAARWFREPAVVTRIWRREVAGEPSGLVAGPCQPQPNHTWYLPGVTTAGGARAYLVVANPFDSDAAISVSLLGPEGVTEPQLLKNIGVEARSAQTIALNEYAPEVPDLGAIVRVRAGRIVAEGWQSIDAAVGGIEGVSLVAAANEGNEVWTVPWFESGPTSDSWLWVANIGDRPAAVSVTVHTAAGGSPPTGLGEVTIDTGTVDRIDLRGVLPDGVSTGGVTVASTNGVPIVASVATTLRGESQERSGVSVQLGQSVPDPRWTVSSGATTGRAEHLHLVNLGATAATAHVAVATPAGRSQPEQLRRIRVPPGALVSIDVRPMLPDAEQHTIFVSANTATLVAGIHAFAVEGRLDLVAYPGVPSALWAGGEVPPVVFAPGLTHRIGTRFGPPPVEASGPTSFPTDGTTGFEPSTPLPTPSVPVTPTTLPGDPAGGGD